MTTPGRAVDRLRDTDRRCLWHPYTRIDAFEREPFPVIERGAGARLYAVDGGVFLDGIASWWSACLGHAHPRVVAAIRKQATRLPHSILGGMSHPPAIALAARLVARAPQGLTRVYFAGDGSSAVEAALRIAVQSFHNRGRPEKRGLIALADGYHGDTLGAVGAGYLAAFHAPLRHLLRRATPAPSPHCFACEARGACDLRCFAGMQRLLEERAAQTAAVIVEPLVQGAAGMRIYPAEYLRRLRTLCDRHDVLLIADEIAVGCGRTGRFFASEHAAVTPDLLCLGKGLTAGTLPMSAVLATESLYDTFRDTPTEDRTFYHGHTFAGNPIAAAAANATLDVFEREDILGRLPALCAALAAGFARCGQSAAVDRWTTFGAVGVVRLRAGAHAARRAARHAVAQGLLIRPLGDILYLCPPLNTSPDDLQAMLTRFEAALAAAAAPARAEERRRASAIAE